MNPNVQHAMQLAKFSPVDYTWVDLLEFKKSREDEDAAMAKFFGSIDPEDLYVEEVPLPAERLAVLQHGAYYLKGEPVSGDKDTVTLHTIERTGTKLIYRYVNTIVPTQPDHVEIIADFNFRSVKIHASDEYKKLAAEYGVKGEDFNRLCANALSKAIRDFVTLSYKPNPLVPVGRPYGDVAKNAKRKRKGKAQFWEWKTVELKSTTALPSALLGGTHASPKPHERIGHWRQYKSGRKIFVKAHIVNKHKIETDGFVFHDYVKH